MFLFLIKLNLNVYKRAVMMMRKHKLAAVPTRTVMMMRKGKLVTVLTRMGKAQKLVL